jgi:hypothetical protein
MRVKALLVLFFLLTGGSFAAHRGSALFAQNIGDELVLKIAVMGPGDELYFWWGHVALVIENTATGIERFYDWGVFSFDAEHFFTNFAMGRLIYCCMVSRASANYNNYIAHNRDITIYTLDLDSEAKEEVWLFVENNVLPENRDYLYHHFRDNCATRIRDIIDLAVNGQFRDEFGESPGRYTLRQHVRRHTWFSPFFDWFLNFLMGQNIDEPITVWQEMFLPSEIGARIEDFSYIDASGGERDLVSSVTYLNEAEGRPEVLAIPRKQWPRELALGLVIAAGLAAVIALQKKKPVIGRVVLGVTQSVFGLFWGISGLLLCFLTFFSNHDYTFNNINIVFINPLLFAAIPLGIQLAKEKNAHKRFSPDRLLHVLWTYVFFGCIFTMLIKLVPGFYQQNQVTQALVLPFAFVLSFVPIWCRRLFRR